MHVTEQEYRRIALAEPDMKWELDCGRLRSKPSMTTWHNRTAWFLGVDLQTQLGRDTYEVRVDAGRTQRSPSQYFIPDVIVIPLDYVRRGLADTYELEAYPDPLPLVVEVWSPSTGDYDVDTKLAEYRRRGDLEVWRIHPYERTLTAGSVKPTDRIRKPSTAAASSGPLPSSAWRSTSMHSLRPQAEARTDPGTNLDR